MESSNNSSAQEVELLIGRPPGWLLYSGISLVAVVVIAFLLMAALIKYPDKIASTGIMTSDSPPIEHFTVMSGIVDSIFIQENNHVNIGDKLLLIQSPCRLKDLNALKLFIETFETTTNLQDYFKLIFPFDLQLGELQQEYAGLQLTFSEFVVKLNSTDLSRRLEILKSEIGNVEKINSLLKKQLLLAESELQIATRDNHRNKTLKSTNVISDVDLEKSDKELLTVKKQYNDLENALIENEIRQQELKLEIEKLLKERTDLEQYYLLKLKEIISILKQKIHHWEERHLVIAKVNGKVAFQSSLIKKSHVTSDQHVLSVLPEAFPSRKYVRTVASEIGIGKVKIGNKAILKIDQYPYKEFGVAYSNVVAISPLPIKDKVGNHLYEIIMPLSDSIQTTYKKNIPFNPNTGIQAEIITEEKSLLERILHEFLDLIKNR